MSILPTARQITRSPRRAGPSRGEAERSLAHAFATFTQAADSLEKSYGQLQTEVARLGGELERANSELTRSLDENSRVRGFLAQILEGLPCGVLVFHAGARLRVINPEARRLLMLDPSWSPEQGVALPAVIDRLLADSSSKSTALEREWSFDDPAGTRYLGITEAQVVGHGGANRETIWILRDMTQEKRLLAEREKSRRNESLAEIATVLAHEIRNPLGSLELFAGLLADTTAIPSEASQWVGQIQAGLRTLASTVNNVLQFHSQPCPEPIPTHLDRLLRETVDFLGPLARQRGMQVRLVNRRGKSPAACGSAPPATGFSESFAERVSRHVAGKLARCECFLGAVVGGRPGANRFRRSGQRHCRGTSRKNFSSPDSPLTRVAPAWASPCAKK